MDRVKACGGDEQLVEKVGGCEVADDRKPTKLPVDWHVPDGGYGWVVVAAIFLTCWTIGIIYTGFSIPYVEFSDYFNAEKGQTGWIGSIYVATGNVLGRCRVLTIYLLRQP